jgi:exosome complex component RRP43
MNRASWFGEKWSCTEASPSLDSLQLLSRQKVVQLHDRTLDAHPGLNQFIIMATHSQSALPTSNQSSIAAVYSKLHPLQYHAKFISANLRTDGRKLDSLRPLEISSNIIDCKNSRSSSFISLGNTNIISSVAIEIGEIQVDENNRHNANIGRISIDLSISGLSHPLFQKSENNNYITTLNQALSNIYNNPQIMNLEQLLVEAGYSCFVLYIDLLCLSFDGNLYDSCIMAINAALLKLKLPHFEIDSATHQVFISEDKYNDFLFPSIPVTVTASIDITKKLLFDPNSSEESINSFSFMQFIYMLNNNSPALPIQSLYAINKVGGPSVEDNVIKSAIPTAQNIINSIITPQLIKYKTS